MSRYWSPSVSRLTPYTPGEQPKEQGLIKLNTNENPYGPSPKVIDAIKHAANSDLRKYPDPSANELKRAIADYYQLAPTQVFVGNSSDEVLGHSFRAFFQQSEPVLTPDISYSFYPVYAKLFDVNLQRIPLLADFSVNLQNYDKKNGGILFANPNAPTGLQVTNADIEELLNRNTQSVVIVDEAYADFAEQSAASIVSQFPNLLVTQTLSKSRSLAGLRVGFALGSKELIEGLERVKNSFHPYTLDSLSIAGAIAAFEDVDYFQDCVSKVIATRDRTQTRLYDLGFDVLPSQTNFVLASHPDYDAEQLFNQLRQHKIVVRYFKIPRIDNHLRISIGTDDEMDTLFDVIASLMGA